MIEQIRKLKLQRKFIYAMASFTLSCLLWFISKWDANSFVQLASVITTGYLVTQAAVDWKYKNKKE